MNSPSTPRRIADHQRQVKLFLVPTEIRRAIYSLVISDHVHIFLSFGRMYFSECVTDGCVDFRGGAARMLTGHESRDDPVWARRLSSCWGPHWKCEEVALKLNGGGSVLTACHSNLLALLSVCQRLYVDIVDFVVQDTVVEITDLDTLGYLLRKQKKPLAEHDAYLVASFTAIRSLRLSLRLPLSFYMTLESRASNGQDSTNSGEKTNDGCHWKSQLAAWDGLNTGISQLKHLYRLRTWLDHDQRAPTWAALNERAILRPFALLAATGLQLVLELPKLHPFLETSALHYMADGPQPPFPIDRKVRQKFFAETDDKGKPKVIYQKDFPVLVELMDFDSSYSLEDIEDIERMCWERGQDPEDWFEEEFNELQAQYGVI